MLAPLVVTDFDGTLLLVDLGTEICSRFADASWRAIDARWHRDEITLAEAQRQMWGLVDAELEELRAHSVAVGRFRAGAEQLFDAAREGRCELVIASGGFDFYVDAILGARKTALRACYANRLHVVRRQPQLEFLHAELACERCAICKAKAILRHRQPGQRVIFCGDGHGDTCVVGACPAGDALRDVDLRVFAVKGRPLATYCASAGASHVLFDDYADVLAALSER